MQTLKENIHTFKKYIYINILHLFLFKLYKILNNPTRFKFPEELQSGLKDVD